MASAVLAAANRARGGSAKLLPVTSKFNYCAVRSQRRSRCTACGHKWSSVRSSELPNFKHKPQGHACVAGTSHVLESIRMFECH